MNTYILVLWPCSQMLMEESWFSECSLADSDQFGSSAYFVPKHRIDEMYQDRKNEAEQSAIESQSTE